MKENESLVEKAWEFAREKHKLQVRKDAAGSPYITHLKRVEEVLRDIAGVSDETILAAAILHDTIEDTDATFEELVELFGQKVADIVQEVTDDKNLPKKERKDKQIEKAPRLSLEACLIKLADKISNVEDVLFNPPPHWSLERRKEYVRWASEVVNQLPHKPGPLSLKFQELVSQANAEL